MMRKLSLQLTPGWGAIAAIGSIYSGGEEAVSKQEDYLVEMM